METVLMERFLRDIIGIVMPIYFINRVMPTNKKLRYGLYSFIMLILYPVILIICAKYSLNNYFKYLLFIISTLYPIFFREGKLLEKIFWVSFYISGVTTISIFCIAAAALLNKYGIIPSYENSLMDNISFIVASRSIEYIYIYIVSKNAVFLRYINSKILLILSLTSIIKFILADLVVKYMFYDNSFPYYFFVIFAVALIFIQIVTFYILNTISNIIEEKYYLEISLKSKQNDEDIMRMHKEIRGWRHDMRNHVNVVLGLLERGLSDEAVEYISEIDKRTSEFEEIRYTDNIAVDSILASKVNLAKEKGVEIELDLNVFSEIKLPNVEICTLLGNLIDNSIEACEKVEENKFIVLKILAQEDKMIIRIKNSTNGKLKEENGKFKTTKINGMHGIGLSQIDSIVEKYEGYIKRTHENNIFDTSIMINY